MASMDFTSRHGTKEDGANKLDIDMLVKLTTRLQKASHTYESLRGDMDKIKEVLALFVLFYFTGMLFYSHMYSIFFSSVTILLFVLDVILLSHV